MARFYGTVQGHRGEATRLGHKELHVTAQSYSGDVQVWLHRDDADNDCVYICARPHNGGQDISIFSGKITDLLKLNKDTLVVDYAQKVLAARCDRDAAEA